jgi:hypothetical protein
VTDAVLVRAPVGIAYRVLTDLDAWPRWLEGCRSVRIDPCHAPEASPVAPADRHLLVLPGVRRPLRLDVTSYGWRHDAGLRWTVDVIRRGGLRRGGPRVSVEWWLEERREGVVIHHLVHPMDGSVGHGSRVPDPALRYRRSVVLAMQALKDHLELAVAHAAGRVP